MKKIIIIILAIMVLHFNISVVTVQNTPICGKDIHGQRVTLYQAQTRHNKTYLLENVTPLETYILIEYKHNIFNSEDNEIILIKK